MEALRIPGLPPLWLGRGESPEACVLLPAPSIGTACPPTRGPSGPGSRQLRRRTSFKKAAWSAGVSGISRSLSSCPRQLWRAGGKTSATVGTVATALVGQNGKGSHGHRCLLAGPGHLSPVALGAADPTPCSGTAVSGIQRSAGSLCRPRPGGGELEESQSRSNPAGVSSFQGQAQLVHTEAPPTPP